VGVEYWSIGVGASADDLSIKGSLFFSGERKAEKYSSSSSLSSSIGTGGAAVGGDAPHRLRRRVRPTRSFALSGAWPQQGGEVGDGVEDSVGMNGGVFQLFWPELSGSNQDPAATHS
jgi:hypothetical protein